MISKVTTYSIYLTIKNVANALRSTRFAGSALQGLYCAQKTLLQLIVTFNVLLIIQAFIDTS